MVCPSMILVHINCYLVELVRVGFIHLFHGRCCICIIFIGVSIITQQINKLE